MRHLIYFALLLPALAPAADADRTADREAIRAHIDRIFQAFIHKDSAELRATHAENWLGYLEGSRKMIKGLDAYMSATAYFDPKDPWGMSGYKMREFDMIFHGDAAFVTFVADVESKGPNGWTGKRALRIADFYTKQNGAWIQTGSDTELHPESAAEQNQVSRTLSDDSKKTLLEAREAVWRAFFAGDRAALEKLLPAELITMEPGGGWGNRQAVFDGSKGFAASGGKLVRLEFPKTEIQVYGYTAIVYSNYVYELDQGGKRNENSGRVTEVFVFHNGAWVNPSWHMDLGK
jgi:ketosteroid isomerase-like protein